jgi:hypothetical protein
MARTSAKQSAAAQNIGKSPQYGWGGTIDVPITELFAMVSGPILMQQMREMWLLDETAGAMRFCITSTMAQVPWKHLPRTDGVVKESDPEAVKWAAWADTLLDDIQNGFDAHVEDALAMIWAGFAPCEIVTKQRAGGDTSKYNDKFYGIAKLPLRDPRTIVNWNYDDNDDLISMDQLSSKGSSTIPMWKLLHYRTTAELNNPQGISLLLAARRAWKLKTKIQDAEALGIERELVGLPIFRVPEEMYLQSVEVGGDGLPTPAALQAQAVLRSAVDAVSKMRLNKTGGLVIFSNTYNEDDPQHPDPTPKYDFKIVTTGGARSIDTRQPIRDYDRSISRIMLMQFLQLGDRSTGSYALSDDQSSMAYKSFMALALKISVEWSNKVLPLIWQINNFPMQYLPQLQPGQINKQALQQMGALLTGLAKSNGLWEADPKMRAAIIDMLGLDYDPAVQQEQAGVAADAAKEAAKPTPPPVVNANLGHNGGPPLDDATSNQDD